MRIFFLFIVFHGFAGVLDHCKKIEVKRAPADIKNIDYVYVINLDERTERWVHSLKQLVPYGVIPQRFSAIYGWTLTPDVLNDIGLVFRHGMWTGKENVMVFPPEKNGAWDFRFLTEALYGWSCFSGWTVKGTIGCSLSHFSVLKDAWESGYQTIWILEDDFQIVDDPHKLSFLLEELSQLVGADGWDVLYTDNDCLQIDSARSLEDQFPFLWRPDMPFRDIAPLCTHIDINDHFKKIGSRMRAHSIIYSRAGIDKIMRFYQTHGNFLPYDQELALIPGINMFVLKQTIVDAREVNSDTRNRYFQN
jgi:glycosyl transferase family 25